LFDRKYLILCVLIFVFTSIIAADEPTLRDSIIPPPIDTTVYPTIAAIQNASIPYADRQMLAQRFSGLPPVDIALPNPPRWEIGMRQAFWVSDSMNNQTFQVETDLLGLSEHVAVWVESGYGVRAGQAQAFALAFDEEVYDVVRELWGSEPFPGVDNDPRIHAVFAGNLGGRVAAYYSSQNSYPTGVFPYGNVRDMMLFNLSTIGSAINRDEVISIAAHEFQHMIRHHVDRNESTWLDEGFAMFTEHYLGYDQNPQVVAVGFINAPQTQLNRWSADDPILPNYGAGLVFVNYFYQRFGVDGIQRLSQEPADGLQGIDNTLKALGEPGIETFFADWVLANTLPTFGETVDTWRLPSPPPVQTLTGYPQIITRESNQYAADYFVLQNVRDLNQLQISLAAPPTVRMLDTSAPSGDWLWYSNRGDDSHTTLSQRFDLTNIDSATLNYRVWYDIEAFWDYAYLTVSADDGATWEILPTPYTTTENPNGKGYGSGYTGRSDGWLNESVSLDAYAGKEIILQFEMITDDATLEPGIALDDIAIPEIGYSSDLEQDAGGWSASGWIHSDNRLPQRVWVQAVQLMGDAALTSRWLVPYSNNWTLLLEAQTDQVILIISPIAPVTIVPMPYTLSITGG